MDDVVCSWLRWDEESGCRPESLGVVRLRTDARSESASFSVDRFVISGSYYRGSVEAVIKPIVRKPPD